MGFKDFVTIHTSDADAAPRRTAESLLAEAWSQWKVIYSAASFCEQILLDRLFASLLLSSGQVDFLTNGTNWLHHNKQFTTEHFENLPSTINDDFKRCFIALMCGHKVNILLETDSLACSEEDHRSARDFIAELGKESEGHALKHNISRKPYVTYSEKVELNECSYGRCYLSLQVQGGEKASRMRASFQEIAQLTYGSKVANKQSHLNRLLTKRLRLEGRDNANAVTNIRSRIPSYRTWARNTRPEGIINQLKQLILGRPKNLANIDKFLKAYHCAESNEQKTEELNELVRAVETVSKGPHDKAIDRQIEWMSVYIKNEFKRIDAVSDRKETTATLAQGDLVGSDSTAHALNMLGANKDPGQDSDAQDQQYHSAGDESGYPSDSPEFVRKASLPIPIPCKDPDTTTSVFSTSSGQESTNSLSPFSRFFEFEDKASYFGIEVKADGRTSPSPTPMTACA